MRFGSFWFFLRVHFAKCNFKIFLHFLKCEVTLTKMMFLDKIFHNLLLFNTINYIPSDMIFVKFNFFTLFRM